MFPTANPQRIRVKGNFSEFYECARDGRRLVSCVAAGCGMGFMLSLKIADVEIF